MDKNMTLEKRIAAELYSYQGKMSVFVDDLHGHTVEIGADEEFETASTIKAYILAALYLQASRGKASLEEKITYKPEHFVDGSGMLRALGVGASLKVKDAATMMIICSDNIATNMVIDYLGLDVINACIREMGFAHTVLHNPLHFDLYDGGIVHTPYGEYVIVLMNKDFHDIIEYNDHPSMVYGARVSRMILDQILACEGELYK